MNAVRWPPIGVFAALLAMCAGGTFAIAQQASKPVDKSVATYSSVVDGQPGSPGQVGITGLFGVAKDFWEAETAVQYTGESSFLEQSLFTLTFPIVNGGSANSGTDVFGSFAWQQRWYGDENDPTNFATVVAVQWPVDAAGEDADVFASVSFAHVTGPGVWYLNGSIDVSTDPGPIGWDVLVGYKRPINDSFALIGDVIYDSTDTVTTEVSAQITVDDHWTVGPGVSFAKTVTDSSDLAFGAGVDVCYGF